MNQLEQDVGRVQGQLEGLVRAFEDYRDEQRVWRSELRESLVNHSKRIRALEYWRWYLLGAAGTVGSGLAVMWLVWL